METSYDEREPNKIVEAVFLLNQNSKEHLDLLPKTFNDVGVIKNIHMFCFPFAGSTIQPEYKTWLFHGFVLTNQNGARLYCHCVRFHDGINTPENVLAICILSKQCYYETMRHFLVNLISGSFLREVTHEKYDWRDVLNYIVHCGVSPSNSKVSHQLSFRGVFQLRHWFKTTPTIHYKKVPWTPSSPRSKDLELHDLTFLFGTPPSSYFTFPLLDFDLSKLFSCLSVPNIISIFECILGEAKIGFMTSHLSLLAHITQSFLTLLFPFTWEHVFVPVLPDSMYKIFYN